MKLTEARSIYSQCQQKGESAFLIRRHCWADYPERQFTQNEVLSLLLGKGHLKINNYPSAKPDSFLWICRDDYNLQVEIAVIITGERIRATAISAYRDPDALENK